jgi:hypothetical protein
MESARGLSVMLRLAIVCVLTGLYLVLLTGCGDPIGATRLRGFVGAGKTVVAVSNEYLVSVSNSSVEFKQYDSNTIIGNTEVSITRPYGGSTKYAFTITLAYKTSKDNYLLEIESDDQGFFPNLKDMYLTYSEDTGYSGDGSIVVNGKDCLYEAKINSDELFVSIKDAANKEVSAFSLEFPKPDDGS